VRRRRVQISGPPRRPSTTPRVAPLLRGLLGGGVAALATCPRGHVVRGRRAGPRPEPARAGDPGPRDPHQAAAARPRRHRPRRPRAITPLERLPRAPTPHISRISGGRGAVRRVMLDPNPRVLLMPGLGLVDDRGRRGSRREDRRGPVRAHDRGDPRRRGHRPLPGAARRRHLRYGVLVARAGQARGREDRQTARRPRRVRHRRRLGHRPRNREALRRRRRAPLPRRPRPRARGRRSLARRRVRAPRRHRPPRRRKLN
jgi:hypothetical protein